MEKLTKEPLQQSAEKTPKPPKNDKFDVNKNSPEQKPKKKFQFKMITGFSILLIIIAIVILVSWILHLCNVNVSSLQKDDDGNYIDVTVPIKPLGIIDIFYEPFKGFINTADIIIFLFVIGAFINVVVCSKALEGSAKAIINKLKGKEVYTIIPLMLFFAICGSVEGMCEESLGFYIICVPLMIMAGFDTITGFMIVFFGAGVGVMAATVDPFAVSTAVKALQNAATGMGYNGAKLFTEGTGLIWRFVSWTVLTASIITFVMIRALRIKKNPQLSVAFATSEGDREFFLTVTQENIVMDWRKKLTITVFLMSFVLMILYIIPWDDIFKTTVFYDAGEFVKNHMWFLTGLIDGLGNGDDNFLIVGTFFLISSIVLGVILGLSEENFISQFMDGARGILSVSLIISVSSGLNQALNDSNIKWIVVGGIGDAINSIHSSIHKITTIFILFIGISMLIPSTSGFANAVLPLMINALVVKGSDGQGELLSIAPNTILAFVMANGFVNLFSPLSAVIFGGLEICRLDYVKFWKFMWIPLLGLFVISLLLLIIGTGLTDIHCLPMSI